MPTKFPLIKAVGGVMAVTAATAGWSGMLFWMDQQHQLSMREKKERDKTAVRIFRDTNR